MRVMGDALSQGRVVLTISLDIANAFNVLPWYCIGEALRHHQMPTTYLCRIVEAYLTDGRYYLGHRGKWNRRELSCDVPQV